MAGGRPLLFNSPDEMQAAIDEYFATDAFIEQGDTTIFAPTVSGLALKLGMTRQSLINYEAKDEFFATIKKAKTRIEVALEQKLYGQTVTGLIFNLKNNFGWKDKSEQELSGPNGGPIKTETQWVVEPVRPVNAEKADG